MGDDIRERPLGRDDAAYMTVVPMWSRYMSEVNGDRVLEEIPWQVPPGINPRDRGGNKGRQAEAPMSLIYRKPDKPGEPAVPAGDG